MTLKPLPSAPDRRAIHARALRAAAAVAFGAACSSSATATLQGTAADSTVGDAQLAGADTPAATDTGAGAATDQQTGGSDAPANDQTADATAGTTDQSAAADSQTVDVASADGLGAKPDCTAPARANGPCCLALQDWCAAAFPSDADLDARNACVFGENFSGTTGCTPWGPPAPPAMGWA